MDLVKDVKVLEAAYDDAAGVTRDFNRNILHVMNDAVDGDFEPEAFRHHAFYNEAASRVEMHLVADTAQTVKLGRLGLTVRFRPGEGIWTENSYKFTRDGRGGDAGRRLARPRAVARGPRELLRARARSRPVSAGGDAAYAQPTPRLLYVHDDLTDEVARHEGAGSPAAALARDLLALLARDTERVRILTLGEQVERVVAQGDHPPFALALGIGAAGQRVAQALHARAGWFPRIRRVGLTREEDGRGGYRVISTEAGDLAAQLDGVADCASLAVVDDTVFSGLTMRALISALPGAARRRTHAFCLRGVAESIADGGGALPDHRGRRRARAPARRRELHQRERARAPRGDPARGASSAGVF